MRSSVWMPSNNDFKFSIKNYREPHPWESTEVVEDLKESSLFGLLKGFLAVGVGGLENFSAGAADTKGLLLSSSLATTAFGFFGIVSRRFITARVFPDLDLISSSRTGWTVSVALSKAMGTLVRPNNLCSWKVVRKCPTKSVLNEIKEWVFHINWVPWVQTFNHACFWR